MADGPALKAKRAGGNIYYRFMIAGKLFRECTYTTDMREATRIANDAYALAKAEHVRASRAAGTLRGQSKDMTLDQAMGAYWTNYVEERELKGQADLKRRLMTVLDTIGPDVLVSTIDDSVVEKFKKARKAYRYGSKSKDPAKIASTPLKPLSASTINGELTALQGLLSYVQKKEKIVLQVIDWEDIRIPAHQLKPLPIRSRILSPEENRKLYAAIRPDYRPIIEFAQATGLRRGNLVSMRWNMINFDTMAIVIKQKADRNHVIAITSDIATILEGELPHKTADDGLIFTFVAQATRINPKTKRQEIAGERYPVNYSGLQSYWKGLIKSLGIPWVTLHGIRKTFGTDFILDAGIEHGSKSLGHSDIKVTQGSYWHVPTPDTIAAAKLAAKGREARNRFGPRLAPKAISEGGVTP